jgi:hypothetical protein
LLVRGNAGEFPLELLEDRRHREVDRIGLHRAGLELADVEQRVDQARHRADRLFLLREHLRDIRVGHEAPQCSVEQR